MQKNIGETSSRVVEANRVQENYAEGNPMEANHVVEVKNLVKTYVSGGVQAKVLKGIDLTIRSQDFIAIMGPSGSGKTTLMNIIGCLDSQTKGEFYLAGTDVAALKDKELSHLRLNSIGFVFQSFHLIHELSALDNVRLSIQFYNLHEKKKIPGRIATERSREVLMSLGMEQHIHKRPMQLSGGQKLSISSLFGTSTFPFS